MTISHSALPVTPINAERFIRAETAKWGAVIKASGAKAE